MNNLNTYTGSLLLLPFARRIGTPLDQVNFVVSMVVALCLSYIYKRTLSPRFVHPYVRHLVATIIGICLAIFCFGHHVWVLMILATVSYAMMALLPAHLMHGGVFLFAMSFLTIINVYRVSINSPGVVDSSATLMVMTQKVTSLAFSLHDGLYKKRETLSDDHKEHAVRKLPNPIEYYSYIFYFQGVIVGPLCFYKDFIQYIEGINFKQYGKPNSDGTAYEPTSRHVLREKLLVCTACFLIYALVAPTFDIFTNINPVFMASYSIPYRLIFMMISVVCVRTKFYFIWVLGELIGNTSGLGFNGYDKKGKPKWDLLQNVNIRNIELSTSVKAFNDNWNIQTNLWLRRICYTRATYWPVMTTNFLSALWHGCYPGYYIAFLDITLFVVSGRLIRRRIRPLFQGSDWLKMIYAVITWFGTHLALSYTVIPFLTLFFWTAVHFYTSLYWSLHLLAILIDMVIICSFPTSPPTSSMPSSISASARKDDTSSHENSPEEKKIN